MSWKLFHHEKPEIEKFYLLMYGDGFWIKAFWNNRRKEFLCPNFGEEPKYWMDVSELIDSAPLGINDNY
ncbi:MAG: hypothetical protein PVI90_02445 [Desulfobacteraceae bacterium]|jgi:hypothetical protein